MDMEKLVETQRSYFNTHQTFDLDFRIVQLKRLKASIKLNMPKLIDAFMQDLNKTEYDLYLTELFLVNSELNHMIKYLRKLARPKKTSVDIINIFGKGKVVPEPYGVCLIVAPWNYPLQLSLVPLIGAIAAGNTVVIKPSSAVPNIQKCIYDILSVFDDRYVACVVGGREETAGLFDQKYDFAFFTGGKESGQALYEKLAKNLTPCVLELGGKSPVIVDFQADLELTAKKLVWGKFLNGGQTCVAPDYCLAHETIKDKLIEQIKLEVKKQFYFDDLLTQNFVKVVNEKQKERLQKLLDPSKVVMGGNFDGLTLEPTIMDNVSFDDAIMQEEIFGAILPIISYTNLNEEIERLKTKDKPLALYFFSSDKDKQNYVMSHALYGGGCINDCIMHLTDSHLPFGGVGASGIGNYHGEKTFETFSHYKSVMVRNSKFDIGLKYMPYTRKKLKLLKKFCK